METQQQGVRTFFNVLDHTVHRLLNCFMGGMWESLELWAREDLE